MSVIYIRVIRLISTLMTISVHGCNIYYGYSAHLNKRSGLQLKLGIVATVAMIVSKARFTTRLEVHPTASRCMPGYS